MPTNTVLIQFSTGGFNLYLRKRERNTKIFKRIHFTSVICSRITEMCRKCKIRNKYRIRIGSRGMKMVG